jgi:LysM repeat protein
VARGSNSVRRQLQLTLGQALRDNSLVVSTVLAVLTLSGCVRDAAPPPTPPAPTLEVVVATQGPPPVPTPGKQQLYEVREGDTLSGIAARFGVSEEAILKQNPDLDPDTVFVGQELVIPPAQP